MFYIHNLIHEIQDFVCRRTFYDGNRSLDLYNLLQVYHLRSNSRPMHLLFWFLNINRCWILCIFSLGSEFTADSAILWFILNDYASSFLIFFLLRYTKCKIWTIWYFFNVLHNTNFSSYFCLL